MVDLGAVRAVGKDATDRDVPLRLRDPRAEVRPIALEARTEGVEMLEYESLSDELGWGGDDGVASLCLDVGRIEGPRADESGLRFEVHHQGHDEVSVVCVTP
jgi:hypothetical protein